MNWNISWILSPYPRYFLKGIYFCCFHIYPSRMLPLPLYTYMNLQNCVCCFSVIQSYLTLCEPMECSMPVNSWTAVCQASLSFTISESFLKLMSIESVIPFNHLILYHPLVFPLSIFPSIRFFSNELALCIMWPKFWSFSFSNSLSNKHSGLTSFRIDRFDLHVVQGTLKNLLQHHSLKASILSCLAFVMVQLTPVHDYWKNHSFDYTDLCWQSHVSPF